MDSHPNGWFAVRVRSGHEKSVASALRAKDFPVFLPLYRCAHQRRKRVITTEQALFSGYLFGSFDPAKRLPVLVTPSVLEIVSAGGRPIPVDEKELAAVRQILSKELSPSPWPFLPAGERVRLLSGPLANLEGIFIAVKGQARLIVSISLLQRSIAVEINEEWAVPIRRIHSVATLPLYKTA